MSYNDRCGEAAAILRRGGAINHTGALREALIEWCESGAEGCNFPPRDLVRSLLDDPANADLRAHVWDGEWHA